MTILFVCSCLEAGRDGVGDYTRRLALACAAQGHTCVVAAARDPFIAGPEAVELVEQGVRFLRLPLSGSWRDRENQLRRLATSSQTDWICLQWVGYGFHPRGVAWEAAFHLPHVARRSGVSVCVMIHEPWIASSDAPLRHRVIGVAQRETLRLLLRRFQTPLVFTSNAAYQTILKQIGVQAELLPLFSNIPPVETPERDAWIFAALNEGAPVENAVEPARRSGFLIGGFFGALYPVWNDKDVLPFLERAAAQMGRTLVLVSAGKIGEAERMRWNALASTYPGALFRTVGMRPPEQISQFLQFTDFGVATTPYGLLGKSGATIAMLDHGTPVVVSEKSRDWPQSPFDATNGPLWARRANLICIADDNLPRRFAETATRPPPTDSVVDTAALLLQRLGGADAVPRPGQAPS